MKCRDGNILTEENGLAETAAKCIADGKCHSGVVNTTSFAESVLADLAEEYGMKAPGDMPFLLLPENDRLLRVLFDILVETYTEPLEESARASFAEFLVKNPEIREEMELSKQTVEKNMSM